MKLPKTCRIERVASTDATRQAIQEPWLDVKAKVIVATNGRALVKLPVEIDETDTDGPITRTALAAARKVGAKNEPASIVATAGALTCANGVTEKRPDVGKFPNWTQVMPRDPGKIRLSFNAVTLFDMATAMGCSDVVLEFNDATSPIKVLPSYSKSAWSIPPASPEAVGVFMPIRLS